MNQLLKRGDIFQAREGMTVYTWLPERFAYPNCSLSTQNVKTDIVLGCGLFDNGEMLDTRMLCGKYVCVSAELKGGLFVPSSNKNLWQPGWYVTAQKLDGNDTYRAGGLTIEFYQTGSFSVINAHVPVIAHMPSFDV